MKFYNTDCKIINNNSFRERWRGKNGKKNKKRRMVKGYGRVWEIIEKREKMNCKERKREIEKNYKQKDKRTKIGKSMCW